MYNQMPPSGSRKRPAPGSSPALPAQQMQSYNAPNQMSNADLLRWSQANDNTSYPDMSGYNMNAYGAPLSQAQYDQSVPAPSTQLTRRPINTRLIPQRSTFDNSDPWGQFGEDSILDPQQINGGMEEHDNIELLEERAAVAKRDAQSKRKQIPPFVQKLSSFLEGGKNTDLIRWSDRGDSFIVLDEDEFAKTLIPELFKHNNYASFVRQLNMYGFHKRVGLSDNSMKASERKNKSPSEYYNPYFKRGHPNLLWLINKPKGGAGQKKGKGRVKNEEGLEDSDDDGRDGMEETFGSGYGNPQVAPRAISAAPESGPLQRQEMQVVQSQLQAIQKQQGAISQAIARLRKDHNQLYQQAIAFQTLHDRHESSINAILTFLATVYNRSLDGQGAQNIAEMFANGIPQGQHQGSVVDMGDLGEQQEMNPGRLSPHRPQQRLLMAPPNGRASTISPASTPQAFQATQPGSIEELFDNSPSDNSAHVKPDPEPPLPQQDIMGLINSTNAQAPKNNDMNFPDVLNHYQNTNGNSPLTPDQRSNMLNMIARNTNTSSTGSNNALVSPTPPQAPSLDSLNYTQAEIDELVRAQAEQEARLHQINNVLQPLSPSGSIPGLDPNGSYFNGGNDDLDQFLDWKGDYSGNSPLGAGNFNLDTFGDNTQFDGAMDGANDGANDGGKIESTTASSAATPENNTAAEEAGRNGRKSPSKRQRRK